MEPNSTTPSTGAESGEPQADASGVRAFAGRHPQLVAWVVLALVMVAMVLWSARDVGLLPGQTAAIVVATAVLAGLCVWIIGWD